MLKIIPLLIIKIIKSFLDTVSKLYNQINSCKGNNRFLSSCSRSFSDLLWLTQVCLSELAYKKMQLRSGDLQVPRSGGDLDSPIVSFSFDPTDQKVK